MVFYRSMVLEYRGYKGIHVLLVSTSTTNTYYKLPIPLYSTLCMDRYLHPGSTSRRGWWADTRYTQVYREYMVLVVRGQQDYSIYGYRGNTPRYTLLLVLQALYYSILFPVLLPVQVYPTTGTQGGKELGLPGYRILGSIGVYRQVRVWSTSRYGSYYCTTLPLYLGTTRSHSYPREATYPPIPPRVVPVVEWVVYSRDKQVSVGIVSMVGYEMSTQMPLYHTYCTISLILVYPTNLSIHYLLVIPYLLQVGGLVGIGMLVGNGFQWEYRDHREQAALRRPQPNSRTVGIYG